MKYFESFVYSLISILVHEISHVTVASIFKIKIKSIKLLPIGFKATIEENNIELWKKSLIYFAGPFANYFIFITGFWFSKFIIKTPILNRYFINLSYTNLYLGIFNTLPILPLDGSRILFMALSVKKGFCNANKYIRRISLISSILFILIGLVQIFLSSFFNFSLIIIGIYVFIFAISKKMEDALMNIKQIFFRRSRLLKRGIYPVRELVVVKNMVLGEILKNLDFDRFHIIYVLDEKVHVYLVPLPS